MDYVRIGQIVNTFGIKGELKVRSFSDFEKERYEKGSIVYIGEDYQAVKVNYYKHHKGFTLVQFEGLEDINLVEKFKDKNIYKSKDDIKPLKDRYYFSDLRDLDIVLNGEVIGKCINVEEGPKYNFLRILKDDKEILVPYLPNFVKNVDLDKKVIELNFVEGLL